MLADYLIRGLKAGAVAGVAFGLFVALVGNPLIGAADAVGHAHGDHGHGEHESAVSSAVTNGVSVGGGAALGLLLGVAFGATYYFLEPAIPGAGDTKSYLLAAAGFLTVSGAPWLAVPPQPPGAAQSLPIDLRLAWYGGMMVVGAAACGAAGYAYGALRSDGRRTALLAAGAALSLVPAVALLAPDGGAASGGFAAGFRGVVAVGQAGLWLVLASGHAWLVRRSDGGGARPADLEDDLAVSAD